MTAKPKLQQMQVIRDFWISDEDAAEKGLMSRRIRAGTIVEMTAEEALDALEAGTHERVK